MAKFAGLIMKAEAHGHVFCFALQFFLSDKAHDLNKIEAESSSTEDSGEGKSVREESEIVELRAAYTIRSSAMQYTRAVVGYQQ